MRNGKSIVTATQYAKNIVESNNSDGLFVLESDDTDLYLKRNNVDISCDVDDIAIEPISQEHTNDEMWVLIEILEKSVRNKHTGVEYNRLALELDFFDRTSNIKFLLKIHEMIGKFIEDNVVWGVGRGSGSASYILFLLMVHDVDPIKYDIDFGELSKEQNY